jgi:hypothetical protein
MKIIKSLEGKKTYIIGILMILLGLLNEDQEMVLQGLGIITLREGIKSCQK